MAETEPPRLLAIMGVSGSGKTTIAKRLAAQLGWPFKEGDDLHPPANVAKMARGEPLDDTDRQPWLRAVGHWLDQRIAAREHGIITCSALKRRYRDQLAEARPSLRFVYLEVSRSELEHRLSHRRGHFMPSSLLASQLATLEVPAADEPAFTINANGTAEQTLAATLRVIGVRSGVEGG